MAYRSSTILALATAPDAIVSVPAGVQADDIVVVGIYIENNTKTISPPAGFTQKYGPDSIAAEYHCYWFWKRLTGADSGTYTFTWTGADPRQAWAAAFSGRTLSGDPFDTTQQGTALATTAFPNRSVTAAQDADGLVFYATWSSGNPGLTGPTNFTERQDSGEIGLVTIDAVTAGTLAANSATWVASSDLMNRLATLLVDSGIPASVSIRPSYRHFPKPLLRTA